MRAMKRIVCALGGTVLAAAVGGCLPAGNYHSARTLEKGTSRFGMTFSVTSYERVDESTGEVDRIALPNLIPELSYHIGVTDDVELGGRVALSNLYLEADAKFRFFRSERLHLALAPALGYQAFLIVQGTTFRLPGILTYDLSDNFSLNASIFGSATSYKEVDEDFARFDGNQVATGASLGFEIRGEVMVLRPAIEFTSYVARLGDDGSNDFDEYNTVNVLLHVGFIGGREKKQLNRIERKLDRVIENQEGRPPGPTDDSDYGSSP